jgi:CheY-like chemotaxis protein
MVVALSADLIFASRIRSAAEASGIELTLAKDPADFVQKILTIKPRLAVLDLDRRGLQVTDTVAAVKAAGVPILAYVSHVREDLIKEAKDAGAKVVARGFFAKNIANLLA